MSEGLEYRSSDRSGQLTPGEIFPSRLNPSDNSLLSSSCG